MGRKPKYAVSPKMGIPNLVVFCNTPGCPAEEDGMQEMMNNGHKCVFRCPNCKTEIMVGTKKIPSRSTKYYECTFRSCRKLATHFVIDDKNKIIAHFCKTCAEHLPEKELIEKYPHIPAITHIKGVAKSYSVNSKKRKYQIRVRKRGLKYGETIYYC